MIKVKRFSNNGFSPIFQNHYVKDMKNINYRINQHGVFAFFDGYESEFLLNHIPPHIRKSLRCFEAYIDIKSEVYNVENLFLVKGISTVRREIKRNVEEIFIPSHSLNNLKDVREVENIFR